MSSDDAPTWQFWFVTNDGLIHQKLAPVAHHGLDIETATDIQEELDEVIEWVGENHD